MLKFDPENPPEEGVPQIMQDLFGLDKDQPLYRYYTVLIPLVELLQQSLESQVIKKNSGINFLVLFPFEVQLTSFTSYTFMSILWYVHTGTYKIYERHI